MDPMFLRNQRYARRNNKNGESATEEYGQYFLGRLSFGKCQKFFVGKPSNQMGIRGHLTPVGWIRLGSCLASHLEFLKYVGNAQNNWEGPKKFIVAPLAHEA
uniref:Uncharacterized protein n=1 Tax=Salix viminalis TaxID=40686 RepID=A0A6N2MZ24_SALVM